MSEFLFCFLSSGSNKPIIILQDSSDLAENQNIGELSLGFHRVQILEIQFVSSFTQKALIPYPVTQIHDSRDWLEQNIGLLLKPGNGRLKMLKTNITELNFFFLPSSGFLSPISPSYKTAQIWLKIKTLVCVVWGPDSWLLPAANLRCTKYPPVTFKCQLRHTPPIFGRWQNHIMMVRGKICLRGKLCVIWKEKSYRNIANLKRFTFKLP